MTIESDILEVLVKHKVLDRTALIQVKYKDMRRSGIKAKQARNMLADDYCLSESTIQYYLYHRKM